MPEAEKGTYSLSLKGEGVSITRNVDQATARAIVEIVLGGISAAGPVQEIKPVRKTSGAHRLSLREFLDDSNATSNPEKILTIGQYLMMEEAQEGFTKDDIKARFRPAGERAPRNLRRDFARAIANGWIAEDTRSTGTYYVTKKGKSAIDGQFGGSQKQEL